MTKSDDASQYWEEYEKLAPSRLDLKSNAVTIYDLEADYRNWVAETYGKEFTLGEIRVDLDMYEQLRGGLR